MSIRLVSGISSDISELAPPSKNFYNFFFYQTENGISTGVDGAGALRLPSVFLENILGERNPIKSPCI